MQMLYNSDNFVVVRFDLPSQDEGTGAPQRGGYEIVDKFARKEIFIEGALAEQFKAGVQSLIDANPDVDPDAEKFDEYISSFTVLAQQPVVMH